MVGLLTRELQHISRALLGQGSVCMKLKSLHARLTTGKFFNEPAVNMDKTGRHRMLAFFTSCSIVLGSFSIASSQKTAKPTTGTTSITFETLSPGKVISGFRPVAVYTDDADKA